MRSDVSVEFWARTPAYTPRNSTPERYAEFFSFASFARDEGGRALPPCAVGNVPGPVGCAQCGMAGLFVRS